MKKEIKSAAKELLNFINSSPTMFHATEVLKEMFEKAGFIKLDEAAKWNLEKNKSYFVERNSSAIIAFKVGTKSAAEAGFRIAGAHTDSPALKLKSEAETVIKNMIKIPVEVYGGPIIATWLDRELSIAGRVVFSTKKGLSQKLVDLKKPLAIVPNLAIHMNREINKGFEYNNQNHLPAIISAMPENGEKNLLKSMVAHELKINAEDILAMDMFLYDATNSILGGSSEELVIAGKIDNLAMCHAAAAAIISAKTAESTAVAMFFDNEEVGSATLHGAASSFPRDILERIILSTKGDLEDWYRAAANSWMISADAAHALHPNFPEKHDPNYAPLMNCGPVIKMNSNFRYATTAESAAYFADICAKAKVPCQKIINRSDVPAGSTIGPVTSSALGIKTVDVGNPMWAMHSIRETAGVYDHFYMNEALKYFFQN